MLNKEEGFRSGFISIIGRPNVGKSTLVNALMQRKVAIVSDKPQTTRFAIRAVVNLPDAQLIMIDNPGFHKPQHEMGERLNREVLRSLNECDGILFLMDCAKGVGKGDAFIAERLQTVKSPVIMALNKTDLCEPQHIEQQAARAATFGSWDLLKISAVSGDGLDSLLERLSILLPEGPMYYPAGMFSDQPEERVIAETIREKVLELTFEEIPHSVAVLVESITPREKRKFLDVEAFIYVERDSQKGMIVGKGGSMLKEIGTRARQDLEALLGTRMFLSLRVKQKKHWRRDPAFLAQLGIR